MDTDSATAHDATCVVSSPPQSPPNSALANGGSFLPAERVGFAGRQECIGCIEKDDFVRKVMQVKADFKPVPPPPGKEL